MIKLKAKGGVFVLILLLFVISPFAVIWSLNTLFPTLAIAYGFVEWLSIILLTSVIKGRTS
jgi:hypothetical protein